MYYRTNRQSIVHIDAIQSVKPHENQKFTLTLKAIKNGAGYKPRKDIGVLKNGLTGNQEQVLLLHGIRFKQGLLPLAKVNSPFTKLLLFSADRDINIDKEYATK